VDVEDVRTIGRRLRQIRKSRGKSLAVIAGLAGMSKSQLDRIERGEVALDKLSEIVALANALQVAPSDLMRLPVPAPANGHTDSTTEAVRLALDAIDADRLDGSVLPVAVLRDQVARIHAQRRTCQFAEVASDLPTLIRNLHTTLATGADHGQLLDLAVYLHVHVTRLWLVRVVAPDDLVRRTVFLARRLAQQRDEVTTRYGRVQRGRHAAGRGSVRAGTDRARLADGATGYRRHRRSGVPAHHVPRPSRRPGGAAG